MKRLLTVLAFLAICATTKAQLSVDLASMRALLAGPAHYGCSTAGCRTKAIEAWEADTTYALLIRMNAAITAAGNLQAVTTLGPNTTRDVFFGTGTTTSPTTGFSISPSASTFSMWSGGVTMGGLTYFGGTASLSLKSAGSYFGQIAAGTLTGTRRILIPDEGNGTGLASTAVIHTTKDNITVGPTTGVHTVVGNDGTFKTYNNTTETGGLKGNAGSGWVTLRDGSSGYTQSFYPAPFTTGTMTADRALYAPDATGTALIQEDTVGGTGDMPTIVTKAYADAHYGGASSSNFANTDLTFTGNRRHNLHSLNMTLDSARLIQFSDQIAHIQFVITSKRITLGNAGDTLSIAGNYRIPVTDGTSGQTLVTSGAGIVTWATPVQGTFLTANGDGVTTDFTVAVAGGTGCVATSQNSAGSISRCSVSGTTATVHFVVAPTVGVGNVFAAVFYK